MCDMLLVLSTKIILKSYNSVLKLWVFAIFFIFVSYLTMSMLCFTLRLTIFLSWPDLAYCQFILTSNDVIQTKVI